MCGRAVEQIAPQTCDAGGNQKLGQTGSKQWWGQLEDGLRRGVRGAVEQAGWDHIQAATRLLSRQAVPGSASVPLEEDGTLACTVSV